jgi:uncharacterized damage-inducible protein DinB
MPPTLADRYRRWFDYERWSHAKVLASLAAVPEERRRDPAYDQALTLLAHLMAARELWLHRLGAAAEAPRAFFPADQSLEPLAARVAATEAAWSAYLARLDDAELARGFEYRSLEGPRFRNTVDDILGQLFGHSWYHRGQIAALVRSLGAEPAVTDLVFWTREPVSGA